MCVVVFNPDFGLFFFFLSVSLDFLFQPPLLVSRTSGDEVFVQEDIIFGGAFSVGLLI